MSKFKINPSLAAALLIGGLFIGWEKLVTISVLLLIFCEIDKKTSDLMTKVLAFLIGISLFSLAWNLISDGVSVIISAFDGLVAVINSYLGFEHAIDISKLHLYLLDPIKNVVNIADSLIGYVLVFAKFAFLLGIITGKTIKENFITKKINELVNKATSSISNFEFGQMQNQSFVNTVQQPQPMQYQNVAQQNTQFPNQNLQQ